MHYNRHAPFMVSILYVYVSCVKLVCKMCTMIMASYEIHDTLCVQDFRSKESELTTYRSTSTYNYFI